MNLFSDVHADRTSQVISTMCVLLDVHVASNDQQSVVACSIASSHEDLYKSSVHNRPCHSDSFMFGSSRTSCRSKYCIVSGPILHLSRRCEPIFHPPRSSLLLCQVFQLFPFLRIFRLLLKNPPGSVETCPSLNEYI